MRIWYQFTSRYNAIKWQNVSRTVRQSVRINSSTRLTRVEKEVKRERERGDDLCGARFLRGARPCQIQMRHALMPPVRAQLYPSCQVEQLPFCFRFLSLALTIAMFLDRVFSAADLSSADADAFVISFREVIRNLYKVPFGPLYEINRKEGQIVSD